MAIIPSKLQAGDEIRVVAPARSLSLISEETKQIAINRLQNELGYRVTFGKHCSESDVLYSSSVESRVEDLHEAFADSNVKAILTVIGGFNSNQILKYLDYELIKSNPKIICGFSDITALNNAIYAKSGFVTYIGPHFSSFGMKKGFEYSLEYFNKCLTQDDKFEILSSPEWSDDSWYKDQENRKFIKNNGPIVIHEGKAEGILFGGNLCTFNLLQGTEYMPILEKSILFIEDDEESGSLFSVDFDRNLQSIIHQPWFKNVQGILIGRFQKNIDTDIDKLKYIIETKKELNNLPIIANMDFGHTTPLFTIPIGGDAKLETKDCIVKLEFLRH